jgi:hypothetical protein
MSVISGAITKRKKHGAGRIRSQASGGCALFLPCRHKLRLSEPDHVLDRIPTSCFKYKKKPTARIKIEHDPVHSIVFELS